MPVSVEKTFRFDAGHRCLGFKNKKEESLHGHTWRLHLVIESPGELGPQKTIFDTNELARVVNPIIENVDHSFIIWSQDPLYERLAEICRSANIEDKLYRVDFNPTAEGLVEHFFKMVNERLQWQEAVLRRAVLHATPTIRASYWK